MTNQSTYRDHELVTQLRQRNQQACTYLYDTYAPALYSCILQIVKEEEIAARVTKDVFLCIWKEIGQYDAEKERFFTWLLKTARRCALHEVQLQNNSQQPAYDQPGAEVTTPKEARALLDHCGLKAVVRTLGKEKAALINLCYFEGLSFEQIAETYQVTAETIQQRVHSALKELNYSLS